MALMWPLNPLLQTFATEDHINNNLTYWPCGNIDVYDLMRQSLKTLWNDGGVINIRSHLSFEFTTGKIIFILEPRWIRNAVQVFHQSSRSLRYCLSSISLYCNEHKYLYVYIELSNLFKTPPQRASPWLPLPSSPINRLSLRPSVLKYPLQSPPWVSNPRYRASSRQLVLKPLAQCNPCRRVRLPKDQVRSAVLWAVCAQVYRVLLQVQPVHLMPRGHGVLAGRCWLRRLSWGWRGSLWDPSIGDLSGKRAITKHYYYIYKLGVCWTKSPFLWLFHW